MNQPEPVIRFQLCNVSDSTCTVSLEPLGDQAELRKGEVFTVEISGPGDGIVEICYEKVYSALFAPKVRFEASLRG